MKISQKGLILVATPLVCQLFFVVVLVWLHWQAEAEVKREVHSKTVIGHADKFMIDILSAGTATSTYGLNVRDPDKAAEALQQYEDVSKDANIQMKALRNLRSDSPEQIAVLDATSDLYTRYDKIARAVVKSFETDEMSKLQRNLLVFTAVRKLNTILDEISKNMNVFLESERRIETESPVVQARIRQNIEYALFGGVAFNILLAVYMAIFFSRDIAARLSVIVSNTRQLARREPLNAPLKGGDEIADLDAAFHETATQLQEVDRLKKEFVSMVSHDLRTPLTAIGGLLEFLEAGMLGELTDKGREHVKAAEHDVQRLIGLINGLLEIDKMESGTVDMSVAPQNLSEILERSVASVASISQSRGIAISVPQTTEVVMADSDRLVQVIVNIISNALKFSEEGSSIEIDVTVHDNDVEVRITDHGRGIPADQLSAIFDRFRQVETEDKKKGTGLGLAICRQIIEQHGGTIGADSEAGKGSSFWFRIPRAPSVSLSPAKSH